MKARTLEPEEAVRQHSFDWGEKEPENVRQLSWVLFLS
jgi:hypothetical protein